MQAKKFAESNPGSDPESIQAFGVISLETGSYQVAQPPLPPKTK